MTDSFRGHVTSGQFKAIVQATQHLRNGKPFEPNVYLLVDVDGLEVKIDVLDLPKTTAKVGE